DHVHQAIHYAPISATDVPLALALRALLPSESRPEPECRNLRIPIAELGLQHGLPERVERTAARQARQPGLAGDIIQSPAGTHAAPESGQAYAKSVAPRQYVEAQQVQRGIERVETAPSHATE